MINAKGLRNRSFGVTRYGKIQDKDAR